MFAIIPAAGKATRFNGIYKELLPINEEGDTGLSNALKLAKRFGVKIAYIITSESKNSLHHRYREHLNEVEFKKGEIPLTWITEQGYDEDLWGAIKTGNDYFIGESLYDHCIMIMPDTIPIVNTIPIIDRKVDFTLGLFNDRYINRYSVLRWERYNSRRVITKPNDRYLTDRAWGIAIWNKKIAKHWRDKSTWYRKQSIISTNTIYDEAFNDALNLRTYRSFFDIDAYYDIGSWERYVEYIKDTQ